MFSKQKPEQIPTAKPTEIYQNLENLAASLNHQESQIQEQLIAAQQTADALKTQAFQTQTELTNLQSQKSSLESRLFQISSQRRKIEDNIDGERKRFIAEFDRLLLGLKTRADRVNNLVLAVEDEILKLREEYQEFAAVRRIVVPAPEGFPPPPLQGFDDGNLIGNDHILDRMPAIQVESDNIVLTRRGSLRA